MKSYFYNIKEGNVNHLQSKDPMVNEIYKEKYASSLLSFSDLRSRFGRNNHTQESLNRGKAILKSLDHLDQYLYSYGPMIQSQWREVSSWLNFINLSMINYRTIDYGCGQGLAGLLLSENFTPKIIDNSSSIFLIEPSDVALVRAEAIYRRIAPDCPIYCIRKNFLDLSSNDFVKDENLGTLHIFSNVIDINGFDPIELLKKTITFGRNILLLVSHDRDHDGGSERIIRLKSIFEDYENSDIFHIHRSLIFRFQCDNPSKSDSISWILDVEVRNV